MTKGLAAAEPSRSIPEMPRSIATAVGAEPAASDGDVGKRCVIRAADRSLAGRGVRLGGPAVVRLEEQP
jgi:hypothetical protein